ncbi:DUF3347 domain-containing protein [Acanthopleuribacter pedis]|uniref:DUF3347 domain-containing protein n=1 Tax=Acanthopleuribacter pedis TaxID=442870 RepID=A0A8J7U387_9BACT|nr:DUF3347 domain-containing protein [Acanthopleuribacter pedis]MBO1317016.1 DUF3347 domain-containing protein [Acanthopleuribacter pedis]
MTRFLQLFAVCCFAACALSCGTNTSTDQASGDKPTAPPKQVATADKNAEPITPANELTGDALDQYITVQETLAADDFAEASAAAKAFEQSAQGALKPLATTLAAAKDITALRTHFRPISKSIKDQKLPAGYLQAYCPMAFNDTGAYWLQKSGTLANPYYGAEMLTCGAVERRGEEAAEKKAEE